MTTPVIIDTDGGVDDAAALWWALTDPQLDVVGITVVWGNVPIDEATASVARVLAAAGRADVPFAAGAAEPIGPAPPLRPATFIHGDDGLGNTTMGLGAPELRPVDEPVTEFLGRRLGERPGQITLVTLGPLSNIGRALRDHPGLASQVARLVVMGGSARVGGNALPNGEANIAHDPEAAAVVCGGGWVEPPLLVGLDVTMVATLTDDHFRLLGEHRNAAAAFLDEPLRFYRRFGSTLTGTTCPCHDLLAVMAVSDPDVIRAAPLLPMAIDTAGGPSWGATVVDFRQPAFDALTDSAQEQPAGFSRWQIALEADVDRFRRHAAALFGA